jgi:hypothetical protein
MPFLHHDEARTAAVAALINWLAGTRDARAVLIDDLFGKYRLILWPSAVRKGGVRRGK